MEFRPLRFRQELLSRHHRVATDQGEAAGFDIARALADAADLSDFDSAWYPQGGRGRNAIRYVDIGGHHRRLCNSRLPVRYPADHPVCRRLVLQLVPTARIDLGRLV